MCIQNNSVLNDNVSNIMSQFDFWLFGYLRHFHFRKLDWYFNPNINPTNPNLGPPNLNRDLEMKMSQITKESEIQLAHYVWDIIIWNRVVLDTHIVGKIRMPWKFLRQDHSNSNPTLTYWASLISDSSLVWDIYISENSNLGPNIDCNWYWQVDLRHLYLLKIKLPQCLWSWNDPLFSSSLRSTYLTNIQG